MLLNSFSIAPEKIDVVYQGCNPVFNTEVPLIEKEILRMKYLLPKSFILYVGTIEERKNLLTLIKALHYGKIDMPLVVIGKPTPYLNKIIEFIERHSLINIIFCDIVQNQDLPGIYQLADLFVYPSIFEGFGIPILEALYSRVPVITSKGSSLTEVGGDLYDLCGSQQCGRNGRSHQKSAYGPGSSGKNDRGGIPACTQF